MIEVKQVKMACLSAVAVAALAGCASQGDLKASVAPVDTGRYGLVETKAEGSQSLADSEAWWTRLGDPALTALIGEALSAHPDMQAASARLARAQAAVQTRDAADMPQVGAHAEVSRQRYTANGLVPAPIAGNMWSTGTLQLQGQWELDLFGRHEAELRSAVGQARAAQADTQAARTLLSANVARAYVQLARQLAQREVAVRSLAQRDELLSLVRQRVDAGLDTNVELRQGEGALPETRQQIEALDEQIALSRHLLAALSAQPMAATAQLSPRLAQLQLDALPAEVPVNLLAQRADVMALRWRAEAAGAEVDAARTLFYPNINIVGFLGFNAIGLDRVLKSSSQQYGATPAIDLPLFDAGRRQANLKGRLAEQDMAVAAYNGSVIEAVHDVADQLTSGQSIDRQLQEQSLAQRATESAYDLALQRYRAGLGPYLTVLSAESAVLNQRRLGVDLRARAVDNRVGFIKALGGHWPASTALAVPGAVPTTTNTSAKLSLN